MKRSILTAFLAVGLFSQPDLKAQAFLKKLKEKAEQALEKKAETTITPTSTPEDPASPGSNSSSGRPNNKGGGGLTNTTPPDVTQQIVDAEQAYTANNFSEARYAVQQALMGVEIQLGKQILKSLPQSVNNLPSDSTNDKVMSTSWGWSNLTIQKIYRKDDKEMNVNIGNNPLYSGLANVYFAGTYAQSTGETQNVKQIKVKGHKAIVKYDNNEGYTLIIPLGQSGVIAFNAINFANEQELMTAVNAFDIDSIKKLLGEK